MTAKKTPAKSSIEAAAPRPQQLRPKELVDAEYRQTALELGHQTFVVDHATRESTRLKGRMAQLNLELNLLVQIQANEQVQKAAEAMKAEAAPAVATSAPAASVPTVLRSVGGKGNGKAKPAQARA